VWFPDASDETGFDVPFRALTMHAVSMDTSEGFGPCIYAQVEGKAPDALGVERVTRADDDDDDDDDDSDFDAMTELRLVPVDEAKLDSLFKTLCDCAALNPDDDAFDEDEDDAEDGWYTDADAIATGAGAATRLERLASFDDRVRVSADLERLVADDPGRFED
jgi:nucleotide-sensitive chloride channel 1A